MRLAYEVVGEGEPVTFLHGFSQGGAAWRELVELLPAGRYQSILVDIRGHGQSEVPPQAPHTVDACTRDLVALWEHLGVERTHLVGYSMGGRLALFAASREPERIQTLLTIGAHAGLEGEERERRRRADDELARRIEQQGIEWFVDHWQALPMFQGLGRRGPEFLKELRRLRLRNRPEGLAASLRGMGPGACEPFWGELAAIRSPSLFVAGGLDERYSRVAERLRESVAGSKAVTVDDAGHSAHMELPDAFAVILETHLSSR